MIMAKGKRFEVVQKEGSGFLEPATMILVDRQTGVNYLLATYGEAGGLTPLLDEEGKPVVTPVGKSV